MEIYELPLVFFTVLAQWGIGGVIALTLCLVGRDRVFDTLTMRKIASAFWLVTVVGSCASLAHLGSPLGAYRAFAGIGRSWLSREVVAFILLNGALTLWLIMCWFANDSVWMKATNWVVCLLGIGAILVSSQIYYQMTLHPLWNTLATPSAFFGTSILLGFASVSVMANYVQQNLPATLKVGLLLGITLVAMSLLMRYRIPGADAGSALFWWQLLASLVVSGWLLSRAGSRKTPLFAGILLVVIILSGEFAGRMLFYGNVMSGAPWF